MFFGENMVHLLWEMNNIVKKEDIIKPIFIIGAPRSGTTLLYNTLCNHKDLGYMTLNAIRAGVHRRGRFLGYRKGTLLKFYNLFYRKKEDTLPHEANQFWKKYFGSYNYLTEEDFIPEMAYHYKKIVLNVQKISGKRRFINKNIQHALRIRLLKHIFDDAKFIHIIRDGRDSAYSTYVNATKLPMSEYLANLKNKILKDKFNPNRSELYNYGLAWQVLVKRARDAMYFGDESYYEIRYENLVTTPNEIFQEIISFAELEWYDDFTKHIPKVINQNLKWLHEISDSELKKDLEESTLELRESLGYF
jgi:omega-hydroxy-beta-dihydromenaquinone-9 sulfotransferase